MRVCMIVRNPCVRDARVLKEAKTLADAGHDLVIIAIEERGVPSHEERDGFRIHRVDALPKWTRRALTLPLIVRKGLHNKPVVGGGAPTGAKRSQFQATVRDNV